MIKELLIWTAAVMAGLGLALLILWMLFPLIWFLIKLTVHVVAVALIGAAIVLLVYAVTRREL